MSLEDPHSPNPLEDSPKCNHCSLNAICLPDETLSLLAVPPDPTAPNIRRLYPSRDPALPFYVQTQGAKVGKSGSTLLVRKSGEQIAKVRLRDVSQLVICGNVQISTQTIQTLFDADIPVIYQSMGGWFYGMAHGFGPKNGYARDAQYAATRNPQICLNFGKAILQAKCANQRTILRRNALPKPSTALHDMKRATKRLELAEDLGALLGNEGQVASIYFQHLPSMIRDGELAEKWGFKHRNRRPPKDPINALLSFGYALLVKDCTASLLAEGLDPYWGLVHQPRHGRPGLALDLMEEFRPLIVDSAVLTAVNSGMVQPKHFTFGGNGCMMNEAARKNFIKAYELRMDQLITHPQFGYRCAWRSIVKMQARFLARWLKGEIPQYVGVMTR